MHEELLFVALAGKHEVSRETGSERRDIFVGIRVDERQVLDLAKLGAGRCGHRGWGFVEKSGCTVATPVAASKVARYTAR